MHPGLYIYLYISPNYSIIICYVTNFSYLFKNNLNFFSVSDERGMHRDEYILGCTQVLLIN